MKRGGRGRGRNQPARHFDQRSYVPDAIQNIDKELQLLKQKKQMMQEQHSMLEFAQYYDNQSFYGQAPYDSPGPSWSNRNSSYQGDQSYRADYIPLKKGKKRPLHRPPTDWSSTEYADGDTSSMTQMFGSRLGPKPARPVSRGRYASRQEPASKRARPNTAAPPKMSQSVPSYGNRKTAGDIDASELNSEDHTLRADREPSTTLNGLLELGLGFVLKQIKQNYANSSKYKGIVTREYYLRKVKKVLRDRIRSIVMDKYIPNYVFVVDQYRKHFSPKTDEELMRTVKEGGIKSESLNKNIEDCKPDLKTARRSQQIFTKNIRNVAKASLKEMFQKILEMYNNEVLVGKVLEIKPTNEENKADEKKPRQKPSKWNIDLGDVIEKRFLSRFRKFMPSINKILNFQPEFQKEKAELLASVMKNDPTMPSAIKANIKEQIIVAEPLQQYIATVRGVPKLPPQTLMRPFLNNYKPKRIRTHKKVKNFLIVTFEDKEKYANFLQQNGKTIGDSTLEIKVSSFLVQIPFSQNNGTSDVVDAKTEEALNNSNDTLISSDMDSQINDLLSSIRQVEEEKNDNNASTVSNQEENTTTENSSTNINETENEGSDNNVPNNKIDMTEASDNLDGQNNDKQDGNITQDNVEEKEAGTDKDGKEPSSANADTEQKNNDKQEVAPATKEQTN